MPQIPTTATSPTAPPPDPPSPPPTGPKAKPQPRPADRRPVLYPTPEERAKGILYSVEVCAGAKAMPVALSQQLLGWTVVPGPEGAHFRDKRGDYIFCKYNTTNREIRWAKVEELIQIHLSRHVDGTPCWQLNGETIIISKHGDVLNGQKSMIAHVLAEQLREIDKETGAGKYKDVWKKPITMEKVIIFGVSSDDRVVNTIDTAQPRTLADVMYRSRYFRDLDPKLRHDASRIANYALKTVWSRCAAGDLAFVTDRKQTHDASMEFLDRHPRLLEAIRWVATENQAKVKVTKGINDDGTSKVVQVGKVERFIEPSRAAALLYLMAASGSDPVAYRYASPPGEAVVDFGRWDKAEDFWVSVLGDNPETKAVWEAVGLLYNKDTGAPPQAEEKLVVIAKAWARWVKGEKLVAPLLLPKYDRSDPECPALAERYKLGGIDLYHLIREEQEEQERQKDLEREKARQAEGDDGPPGDPSLEADGGEEDFNEDEAEPDAVDEEAPVGPVGGSAGLSVAMVETLPDGRAPGDPSPAELARLRARNRANDDESPEQERKRREEVERRGEAERLAEKLKRQRKDRERTKAKAKAD